MLLTLLRDISLCPTFYFLELCPEDPKPYWSMSEKDLIKILLLLRISRLQYFVYPQHVWADSHQIIYAGIQAVD